MYVVFYKVHQIYLFYQYRKSTYIFVLLLHGTTYIYVGSAPGVNVVMSVFGESRHFLLLKTNVIITVSAQIAVN
jgi:hypothetical protein